MLVHQPVSRAWMSKVLSILVTTLGLQILLPPTALTQFQIQESFQTTQPGSGQPSPPPSPTPDPGGPQPIPGPTTPATPTPSPSDTSRQPDSAPQFNDPEISRALATAKSWDDIPLNIRDKILKVVDSSTVFLLSTYEIKAKAPFPFVSPQDVDVPPIFGFCTGSFIGDSVGINNGHILTSAHCVEGKEEKAVLTQLCREKSSTPSAPPATPEDGKPPLSKMPVECGEPTLRLQAIQAYDLPFACLRNPVGARQIAILPQEKGDAALFKVDGIPFTPTLPVATREPMRTERMLTLGFSGQDTIDTILPEAPKMKPNSEGTPYDDDPSDLAKDLQATRLRATLAEGMNGGEKFLGDVRYLHTQAPLTHGQSGGPTLIIDNGKVAIAGINAFVNDIQPFNYITSTEAITGLLRGEGLIPAPAAANTSNASSQPTPDSGFWDMDFGDWLAVLLAVAAIAWLIYRLFRWQRRRQVSDQDHT